MPGKPRIVVDSVKSGVAGEYMGRAMPGRAGSVLGNPFRIRKESLRAETVKLYATWLRSQLAIKGSPQSIEVGRLVRIAKRDGVLRLLCWCRSAGEVAPACHCDAIATIVLGFFTED
jgi:hypothetical protein